MKGNRIQRINSLLKEVIFDVIQKQVRNPNVNTFVTVTRVDTSQDLYHAKVYVSMIASDEEKEKVLKALETAAGFIAVHASKQVSLRHFPSLSFKLDHAADDHFRIEQILSDIEQEKASRPHDSES